jgi:hypothetical protein
MFKLSRVPELGINSEKPGTSPEFEQNAERSMCSLFSVTREHDSNSYS